MAIDDHDRPAAVPRELIDSAQSADDVAAIIELMLADLRRAGHQWANQSLEQYLDALGAFTSRWADMCAERGEPLTDRPTWRYLAEVLVAATGYE